MVGEDTIGWSVVVLLVLIDDKVSKYHLASPGRTFVFGCFRLVGDDCDHALDRRQRERCIVDEDLH